MLRRLELLLLAKVRSILRGLSVYLSVYLPSNNEEVLMEYDGALAIRGVIARGPSGNSEINVMAH